MELKTFEDWVVEPQVQVRSPAFADDSGFGGGTMQYQVAARSRPHRLGGPVRGAGRKCADGKTTTMPAAVFFIRKAGSSTTCAAWAASPRWRISANVVLAGARWACRSLVKDVGRVEIGIAPRLGEFGFGTQDDAVEGVILLRTGEKTQDVLRGSRSEDQGTQ